MDLILVWVALSKVLSSDFNVWSAAIFGLSKILSSDFNVWSGDEEMVGSCVG